ncbi:unnamed protein product [Clonostachys chloroleuca]|uniref:F-box domain-containing protein n=1 Tax=Clonostachys chloroleuca TaxID=1926264 RepID=A0AA35MK75_9HYPO|nr:unnamed protein product [Clonostachys chloroleuca]
MAAFPRLPEELIVEILSRLPRSDLENISISLLRPVFKSRRDTKRLIERFGPLDTHALTSLELLGQLDIERPELMEGFGLSPQTVFTVPPANRLPNLDYMHLRGDCKWLEPLTGELAEEASYWEFAIPAARGSNYDDLISSADRVGVTLPPALLKFIRDEELQKRFPSGGDLFSLGSGGIRKVPKSLDGGVGGYQIAFLHDHQGSSYQVHLYIEPGSDGASCVLLESLHSDCGLLHYDEGENEDGENAHCPNITDQDRQDAKKMGVKIIRSPCSEFTLIGVDFEVWLAATWYGKILFHLFHLGGKAELVTGLKEYVKRELVS